MTATLRLRDYQTESLKYLDDREAAGELRTAIVLPTGMGKTVIFAEKIRRSMVEGRRPIVLVHREELAAQAADKIRAVSPGLRIGIVKAERDELDADALVCSVPTLA